MLVVRLMVLGWCGLVLLDGREGEKNDGYQGIPILRFLRVLKSTLKLTD